MTLGASKAPLFVPNERKSAQKSERTYPGPSRERGRIVVHVFCALKMAHRKHTRLVVESESPIPNGLTTVAADNEYIAPEIGGKKRTYVGQRLDF